LFPACKIRLDQIVYGRRKQPGRQEISSLAITLLNHQFEPSAKPFADFLRDLALLGDVFVSDHPEVAIDLSNLAALLQATNRLSVRTADAEATGNLPSIYRRHQPRTSSPERGHCELLCVA
jgi:hypothetical protein